MKVNVIKHHHEYPMGIVDVDEDRARYLIGVGVAEGVKYDIVHFEKEEKPVEKEKKENKTENVPTAKKKVK